MLLLTKGSVINTLRLEDGERLTFYLLIIHMQVRSVQLRGGGLGLIYYGLCCL